MLKAHAKSLIARFGRQHWRLHKNELLILMYHRVLPADYPTLNRVQPGMWVHPETLRKQLGILKNLFELVSLDDWITAVRNKQPLPKRACAITFDDGWHDNHDYALPVLQDEQVPATIFLTTDLIGTSRHFFPERLIRLLLELLRQGRLAQEPWLNALVEEQGGAKAIVEGPESASVLDRIVIAGKRFSELNLRDKLTTAENRLGLNERFDPPDLLTWPQVTTMATSGLITFGAHTKTHLRLDRPYEQPLLDAEIVQCKKELLQHTGQNQALFCYPNGDATPQAEALVLQNYPAALTTTRGWNHRGSDLHKLRRIGISEGNGAGRDFLCRLSGWV